MWYRIIPASLVLALLAGLVLVASSVADESRKDKDTSAAGDYYQGRIDTVDADKRALALRQATLVRASASKGKRETRGKNLGTMSFTLTRDAKVTLDGKAADIKNLKAGQWARVHVARARASADRPEVATIAIAIRRDTKITPLMADRVEASSRAFPVTK
jgi:hypothetical protein